MQWLWNLLKTAAVFEAGGFSMQRKPCFQGREAPFENVLQVVPLGAYFSNRSQRLLAHQSGKMPSQLQH